MAKEYLIGFHIFIIIGNDFFIYKNNNENL